MNDIVTPLLSVKDIKRVTRLGHTKVHALIRDREIKTLKIGRRRFATQAAVQEFIDRCAANHCPGNS